MSYLDKEGNFYDYKTKEFDGVNPFDITKTGVSFYNQFLTDPLYMEEYKNLKHSIIMMTPEEYFNECAKIFNSSKQKQIDQTRADRKNIEHLKQVLLTYKRTFPLTYLNYAEETQEGRHRMYVVGELLGWDKKFPVMIVNWVNPEKQKEKEKAQESNKKDELISIIDEIADNLSTIKYNNIDELIEDFKYYLKNNYNYNYNNVKILYINNTIEFNIQGVEYRLPIWRFNIEEQPQQGLDDYDPIQLELELKRMGL